MGIIITSHCDFFNGAWMLIRIHGERLIRIHADIAVRREIVVAHHWGEARDSAHGGEARDSARRIGIVVAHGVGEGGRIIISDRDTGANFI